MTKKTIYVIVEYSGYDEEGYSIGDSYEIEAYEFEQDAMLALWYWHCDQIEKGFDSEWDGDCQRVYSEGDNGMAETLDRSIMKINLWA